MGQADVYKYAKIMPHGFVFHWEKCIIMAIRYRIKDMSLAVRARMRLVTKLEKRFNVALETLELDVSATADSSEIEALSKQVSDLKGALVEKDATVATLTSQAADLNKQSEAASEKIASLKASQAENEAVTASLTSQVASLEKTSAGAIERDAEIATLTSQITEFRKQSEAAAIRISDLKEKISSAELAETAAVNKITKLKGKLEEAAADTSGSAEILTKMEDLEDEVEGLRARLNVSETNALNHYEKMRRLRGAHRAVRASLKGNVLNADEVNAAMEAELEALQMQREIDLNEVNIVLEKLTPLVEGK
jgi:predicted  nucleic acid-binding Zn-ribbon protein